MSQILLLLVTFFLSLPARADCPSPFAEAASGHFWFQDRNHFQQYKKEVSDIKSTVGSDSRLLSEELQKRNRQALTEFLLAKMTFDFLPPKSFLPSKSEADALLNFVKSHPVIGDAQAKKYDASFETGFCFGRAAFVHVELLKKNIEPQHIAKVFVIGGLYREGTGWDYHVATAVQGAEGLWWVIDTLAGSVLPLQSWILKVSEWDGNRVHPRLRFYFSEATKFLPLAGSYESSRLSSPLYKGYFTDLQRWFAKDSCQK